MELMEDTAVGKETHMAPLKILFIGNSFTARNNLLGLIAQLAAARGKSIQHRLISTGGASLRIHWNAGEALNAINDGHYDYVVLQEQSTLPIKNAKRMHDNVRLFDNAIKASGAEDRPLLDLGEAARPKRSKPSPRPMPASAGSLAQ